MRSFSRSRAALLPAVAAVAALAGCASASSSPAAETAPSSGSPAAQSSAPAAPSSSGLPSAPAPSTAPAPPRAAGDTVPAAARVAMLTDSKGLGGNGTPPSVATATVTSAKQVAALAEYLDKLAVNPPGQVYSCPDDTGGAMTITFRAAAGGPVLASVKASLSGCGFITYAMPHQKAVGLGGPSAGGPLLAEVNRVTGLGWKVPR
jgi:hypothetical protein